VAGFATAAAIPTPTRAMKVFAVIVPIARVNRAKTLA
jgi:hypothetical protein